MFDGHARFRSRRCILPVAIRIITELREYIDSSFCAMHSYKFVHINKRYTGNIHVPFDTRLKQASYFLVEG